jgi:G-protein alpha subunit
LAGPETNGRPGRRILKMVTISCDAGHGSNKLYAVNAIIFLAPISVFDQFLAEVRTPYLNPTSTQELLQDSRVNRVEDSLLLWKSLVENKLLANVNIILFLNKCDLLKVWSPSCAATNMTDLPAWSAIP